MKRLLLLLLVFTGMASTASADDSDGVTSDIYLTGAFNSWSTSANKFEKLNNYEFVITLTGDDFTAYKNYNYFKLYVADWDSKWVGPWDVGQAGLGTTKQVSKNTSAGDNDNFYVSSISNDAIGLQIYLKWTEVNTNNWQFQITAANIDRQYKVAFVNDANWSDVYLYSWEGDHYFLGAWKGEELAETNHVYSKTFYASSSAKIIFNTSDDGSGNTAQTSDLSLTDNGVYNSESTTSVGDQTVSPGSGIATYSSIYPLDFSSTTNITAYTVSSLTNTSATLTPINQAVPAQTGLIIMGSSSEEVSPIATTTSVGTNYLKAAVTATNVAADGDAYILYDGLFHPANAGTIPAGKAYLLKSDVPTSARSLSLVFDDETTGINTVKGSEFMVNGSDFFDLQGRKVAQPTKGLYIVNGKKVIIK